MSNTGTDTENSPLSSGNSENDGRPDPPVDNPKVARRLPRDVWAISLGLGVITLVSRLWGLGRPKILVFDEVYYATQAWEVGRHGVEQGLVVHPPAAKWVMALGIRVLGFTPWGWRITAEYFAELQRRALLRSSADPFRAAQHFIALCQSGCYQIHMIGDQKPPNAATIAADVNEAVKVFCAAYGPQD